MTKHAGIWIVLSIALAAGGAAALPQRSRGVVLQLQDEEFANGILADFTKDLRACASTSSTILKPPNRSVSISELLAQKATPL